MNREVWYGSPVAAGLDSTLAAVTATITFNERTIGDLSRLVGWACADALATTLGYAGSDLVNSLEVSDLSVYGSDLLIVGRNTPTASLPLAADRFVGVAGSHAFNLARFGQLPFASSDTISMDAAIEGTNIQGSFGIAVPGTSGLASDAFTPRRPCQYLGEGGGLELAAGASGTLTITADRAGWIPLSDLTISALQDAAAAAQFGAPNIRNALASLYITQIELPGSDLLVRGTGTTTVPAAAYAANRQGSCINHGGLHVDAGSAISISITNAGFLDVNIQAGVPFFASETKDNCGPRPPKC